VETSDGLNTKVHVLSTYRTAVELFAHLCIGFDLDPLADGVVISHSEGYKRGIASNHGDVEHLWKKFGLTMVQFREDIKLEMIRQKHPISEWAKEAQKWAVDSKISDGTRPKDQVTREELWTMLYRYAT